MKDFDFIVGTILMLVAIVSFISGFILNDLVQITMGWVLLVLVYVRDIDKKIDELRKVNE